MDQQKLRNLVFEKTGVRIDVDDPVFALVALNEAVLAEAVERHVALLGDATAELAGRLQDSGLNVGAAMPRKAASASQGDRRIITIAGGAALLGALLVLLGQAILFKPPPVVQAKELSQEQASALRKGEKLATIVEKLDAKTRDKIQAELQKP
ncbi:MAG: hypothetical protein JWQ01_913 [Massilia sp.]|nr:hypothetical protein [Massilia sp.]